MELGLLKDVPGIYKLDFKRSESWKALVKSQLIIFKQQ